MERHGSHALRLGFIVNAVPWRQGEIDRLRVFDLSTRINPISRGEGRSATAAAAYRACCVIECEREKKSHDYTRKSGLDIARIILPKGAPTWAMNRAQLWNAAEMVERNGARGKRAGEFKADAQTAREFFFAFPHELSLEGRRKAAEVIARHLADTHGLAVDYAIHAPGKDGDSRNWHCHMLATTRRMTEKGLGAKAREWGDKKQGSILSKQLRAFIAGTLNAGLAAEGLANVVRVEHRSFKDRGSSQQPTKHMGPTKTHVMRKQQRIEREKWLEDQRKALETAQQRERAAVQQRHQLAYQEKRAELSRQLKEAAAVIRQEIDAQRRADQPAKGFRRALQMLTGQAKTDDQARQQRDQERVAEARAKLATIRTGLQAEMRAFRQDQAREAERQVQHHTRQERQWQESIRHRSDLDLAFERSSRTAGNDNTDRQQGRQQGQGRELRLER